MPNNRNTDTINAQILSRLCASATIANWGGWEDENKHALQLIKDYRVDANLLYHTLDVYEYNLSVVSARALTIESYTFLKRILDL